MKYTFTFTINMIAILKYYLIGFIIAYFLALFFILNTRTKNERKQFIFFNKAIIVYSFMSWFFIINYIFFRISLLNKKMNKKCFLYRRLKDILKGMSKRESLYLYCNNRYFRKVRGKINDKKYNKLLYRIMKKELKIDGYSDKTWNNYIISLTLKEFENYFDYSEIEELKDNYEILAFKRFSKIYL
jgi:hypothetical protein